MDEEIDRLYRLSMSLDDLAAGANEGVASDVSVIDLAPVIEAALGLSQPGFERRRIKVNLALGAGLLAHANPDHVAQVLLNLFQNAARYTPEGGSVAIRGQLESSSVLISVSNSGEGIPETDLPHVFERFYRVEKSRDRTRGGAGIGVQAPGLTSRIR